MPDLKRAREQVGGMIRQQMQIEHIPGVAIAVTDRRRLLAHGVYGLADVAAQTPIREDTLFEIGSISKSFTTIALLQLAEAGQIDLQAPVSRYLPWFQVPSSFEPITLHHLLCHSGGIITGTDFSTEAYYEAWALRETKAATPPGSFFHYSNLGYKALGLVLESVLGRPYHEIIRGRILEPLGMASSESAITHRTRERLAVGYELFYDDRPAPPGRPLAPATWLENATADGSISATASDMAAYIRMLLNEGDTPQGRLISLESFALLTRPAIESDPDHGGFYGYGLCLREQDGRRFIHHDGGMVGYYSSLWADRDDGLGSIVLINGPGEPNSMARFALEVFKAALHGRELPALPPRADPGQVQNAADYVGTYRCGSQRVTVTAEGQGLVLQWEGEAIPLEPREPDTFYADSPNLRLFLLQFGREEGEVVEFFYGPDWYTHERYGGPRSFEHPAAWAAYAGHYRSYNPWYSNFRVVLRKGALVLIEPDGDTQALVPLSEGAFRIGQDERLPEVIRFGTLIGGLARRANVSGCDYYRTFTP